MKNTLTRKGYARIYTENEADIIRVKEVIRNMDEFEFDYLPDNLIAPFSEYPKMAYTYKFDSLCMNGLTAICWSKGIRIWVMDNGFADSEGRNEYPEDEVKAYYDNLENKNS